MTSKNLVIGLVAHVDAGKTTLAEGILYQTETIRSMGRVDHGNAYLDTDAMEKDRGITIFSKQAQVQWQDRQFTLLDTPGHVDFSAEMERTLQVLDGAVLIISGSDGVSGHTKTLWRLLKNYEIPTFLFVNKMDLPGTDRMWILNQLRQQLSENVVAFDEDGADEIARRDDQLAMCGEELMESYLEKGTISDEEIMDAVARRQVFPCYFGTALHVQGVQELLDGLAKYAWQPEYPEEFGARVFKVNRDSSGQRQTYLKVTGGTLKVKMSVSSGKSTQGRGEPWEQKVDQIRIYHGGKYITCQQVEAGSICAVTGLDYTYIGEGLGYEEESEQPMLVPVLSCQLLLPEGGDALRVLGQLRLLEEENPEIHLVWKEHPGEIHVQVMGDVQIEILQKQILERFGLQVGFGNSSILYKETLAEPVVGIGHFEPLRHYAEVHLLLSPGEPGSGIQVGSLCSEDILDKNWQRLILTHVEERKHRGVLMGAELTDVNVMIVSGRAHKKHTEGGDFRQATYRAIRQGLRRGKSLLLEPVFAFQLEVPAEQLGRAMSDIQRMNGKFDAPEIQDGVAHLTGKAPVATMQNYQREVRAYTGGMGQLSYTFKGYEPCHNTEQVLAAHPYDPEADLRNPTGSVFCAHGAGFQVEWDRVAEYAHMVSSITEKGFVTASRGMLPEEEGVLEETVSPIREERYISQEEIEEIFRQTYGKKPVEKNRYRRYHRNGMRREVSAGGTDKLRKGMAGSEDYQYKGSIGSNAKEYLLVDGYNIIFAWEELRQLAERNMDSARDKLMDILCNYQGYTGCVLILVFDAYKVKNNPGSTLEYHNIHVVYTKEAETADQYIEKTVHEIGRKEHVTVATSDALEQMIIWGDGARRMSAQGLKEACRQVDEQIREKLSSL
ncbi:MAG: TetM/TetW/TetO/TetS family tetracycline resistance ribosomal protection protein [Lachnospiraceae bacterium]|nr:TetM/TetW/TetO/TetS family tetracycline resistance ribosomal protection protein [Lachnospiraceae bacterium]